MQGDRYVLALKRELEALRDIQSIAQALVFLYKTGAPEDYKAMLATLDQALMRYRELKAAM